MTRQLSLRLGLALLSVWGAISIVFIVTRLTGDPARLMAPPAASEHDIAVIRTQLGLDDPIYVQYGRFLKDVAQGSMGKSYYWSRPALPLVAGRIKYTLLLAALSLGVALLIGVPLGLAAAYFQRGPIDRIGVGVAMLGQAVPAFWLAPLLILLFAVKVHFAPVAGLNGWRSVVLPTISLAAFQVAVLVRITRAAALEALGQDYVRLARSKGASGVRLMVQHVLPNAGFPVLTLAGLALANLIGGSVIIESIFGWPGMGNMVVQAVDERDFPVIQAGALIFSLGFVFVNTVVDVLYLVLDPRVRHGATA